MALKAYCIGAQKAGTTWLYRCLKAHPETTFGDGEAKEKHYWDNRERGKVDVSLSCYLKRFVGQPGKLGIDITPAYALLSRETVAQVHAALPHLRVVFILRDPVPRAWSAIRMYLRSAQIQPDEVSEDWLYELSCTQAVRRRGVYAETLRVWLDYFNPSQFAVLDYQQISRNPRVFLQQVSQHIGLPDDEGWLTRATRRRPSFAGTPHDIPPRLAVRIAGDYRQDTADLKTILQDLNWSERVDMSSWL